MDLTGSTVYRLTDEEISFINSIMFTDVWKALPTTTLLYYSVRLRKIRQRVNEMMVIAPLALQGKLAEYDTELANAISLVDASTSQSDIKLKLLIPDDLIDHPYINVMTKLIDKGMTKDQVIRASSEVIGISPNRLVDFMKSHDIKIADIDTVDASESGVESSENKPADSDNMGIKVNGMVNPVDTLLYIDGFINNI